MNGARQGYKGHWRRRRTWHPAADRDVARSVSPGRPGPDRGGHTEPITLGVEEEYLVVDAGSGALTPRSHVLLPIARPVLGDAVAPELNLCQIEVDTEVCTSLDAVRDQLTRLRQHLAAAAEQVGSRIAAAGTHPFSAWYDQRINAGIERYREMEDKYRIVAREQVICGCHVHVGIEDPDLAIEIMNRSRPWLPVLLALSANSPFWQGVDTGFASYRTQVWQRWPTSGMPPALPSRRAYDDLVDELESVGAIEDATFLYWYVRPSTRYATLEVRVCDVCLNVEDAVAVAGLVRALAWTCARDALEGRPQPTRSREALEAAIWRAGRFGLDAQLVDPVEPTTRPAAEVVAGFLDHVREGLELHGDVDVVRELVTGLLARGNGASRQRAAHAHRGDGNDVLDYVVAETLATR